jgi:hypothetical protein
MNSDDVGHQDIHPLHLLFSLELLTQELLTNRHGILVQLFFCWLFGLLPANAMLIFLQETTSCTSSAPPDLNGSKHEKVYSILMIYFTVISDTFFVENIDPSFSLMLLDHFLDFEYLFSA